jgi:hypothetical protein
MLTRTPRRGTRLSAVLFALALVLSSVTSAFAAQQSPSDAPSSGTYVADLGFRPASNGFSFENYGDDLRVTNLTAEELRRMFGDEVCANLAGGKCTLTPPAKRWMAEINRGMADGHCEGIAALSLLMFLGVVQPTAYGASSPSALSLSGNQALQREIAYWFATQFTTPTGPSEMFGLTPGGVADTLARSFAAGSSATETYTMGIFQRDGGGGHSILPYAVEDRGNGITWIMVYDNNHPGAARHIEVDRGRESWRYYGSTNAAEADALYEGDASTHSLTLTPTSTRLLKQACPFCLDDENSAVGGAQRYDQLTFEGDGHVLITDSQGRRFGLVGNQLVTEIPGVAYAMPKSGVTWSLESDPVYFLPAGQTFTVTIDGTSLRQTGSADLTLVGPGYDLSVEDITLRPGQQDTLVLSPSRGGGSIAYTTAANDMPSIFIGSETKAADYSFGLQGLALQGGGTVKMALDQANGQLAISTSGGQGVGTYALEMVRTDDYDELTFSNDRIRLRSGDTAYLNFGSWKADRDSIPLSIDYGTKGSIDEVLDLTDA